MGILKMLLVLFLTINAVFWGLFPHHTHCHVATTFGLQKCPSHWIHITMGLIFFVCAILTAQWHHFH